MAIPPRTAASGTFFITTITYNRRRLFQLPANADLFLETLQHYRTQGAYKLHAFVVMPDHVHLLLTPNAKTISQIMNLIKGGFSRHIASKFPVWQRGFADHLILDRDHFESRRTYIHQNPVRANLVTAAELYPYSSAFRPEIPATEKYGGGGMRLFGTRKRVPFRSSYSTQDLVVSSTRKDTRLRVP